MSVKSVDQRSSGWLRFDCPVCGGWLAVPEDVSGDRVERVARRIDAFTHRHGHLGGRGVA